MFVTWNGRGEVQAGGWGGQPTSALHWRVNKVGGASLVGGALEINPERYPELCVNHW